MCLRNYAGSKNNGGDVKIKKSGFRKENGGDVKIKKLKNDLNESSGPCAHFVVSK